MQLSRFPRQAFTLIELLIVVAIIAILAAIAVPNFLEAQMRAKVSRVKNDFRTVATGIEAKAIENNGKYNFCPSSRWSKFELRALTTPVAYLTSLPDDPFLPAAMLGYRTPEGNMPSAVYLWHDRTNPNNPHPNFPTYFNDPSSQWYPSFKLNVGRLLDRQWFLVSQGPNFAKASNGFTPSQSVDWKRMPYDPTNGTASLGLIVRVGP